MKNRWPVKCANCGIEAPAGTEMTWTRPPGGKAKWWHIECPNGTKGPKGEEQGEEPKVDETSVETSKPAANGGDFMQGFANAILPFIEDKLKGKLDGEQVEAIVKRLIDGAIFPTVTTVKIEDPQTGDVKDCGIQHKQFPLLLKAMSARKDDGHYCNVLLTGPTGSGKTRAFEEACKVLGIRHGFVGAMESKYDLLGYKNSAGQAVCEEFEDFFVTGGGFAFEEMDSWGPQAQLGLNNGLANGKCAFASGTKNRSFDFRCVGMANTYGLGADAKYVGRSPLDAAFLSRFSAKIYWGYDEDMERALCKNRAWADRVIAVRHAAEKRGLQIVIDPRKTYEGAAYLEAGIDWPTVEEITLFAGMKPEHVAGIKGELS